MIKKILAFFKRFKMIPVAVLEVTMNYESPLLSACAGRRINYSSTGSVILLQNGFGKRRAKTKNKDLRDHASLQVWLLGGPMPKDTP